MRHSHRANPLSLLAVLLLLILAAAVLLPVVYMLGNVFVRDGSLSLGHVTDALRDWRAVLALARASAVLVAGTVALSLALGAPLGFLCFRTDMPWRGAVVVGTVLAASIPLYISAAAWCTFGGMPVWSARRLGVIWIQGLAYTPYAALISGVCFAHSDPDLEDAARLDAGRASVLLHVMLPQTAWGLVATALSVGFLALADITVSDIFMVRSWAEQVFVQWQLGEGPQRPMAAAYPLMIGTALLAACLWRWLREHGTTALPGGARRPCRIPLGRTRWTALGFCAAAMVLCLGVPVASLVRLTGSVRCFVQAAADVRRDLAVSLSVTPLTATLACVLALPAARLLGEPGKGRRIVAGCLLLLLCVPAPIVGIGVIRLFNRAGPLGAFYDSPGVLVLAACIRVLPFTVLALLPAVKRVLPQLRDAALLEGCTWPGYLRLVLLPLCWRALLVAWFLAFILAIAEIGASVLVAPPGFTPLSVRFFTLVHYGVYPSFAAMCLMLLAAVLIPATAIVVLLRRTAEDRYL